MANHQKIVGDEQIGQVHLLLQVMKHIDDLGLDGYVQSRHRLVADHKLRLHRQGPGNADPLPLPSGKFVSVPGGVLGVQPHPGHQLQYPLLPLLSISVHSVYVQGLCDKIRNGHSGVQGGIRVLEDHGSPFPIVLQVLPGLEGLSVKNDLTGGGLVQMQQRSAHGGLAAAGLPHQPQRFATANGERNIIHRL